jgi:hypothetical protein
LPKLYYPTPDELQGAKPLWEGGWGCDDNQGSWFHVYQELLVRLANTDYGRDLLCIDKHPYPVISMRKNMVQFDMGTGCTLSDVRIGAKWGNVIRYRWSAVKKALDQMNLEILLALPQYVIHEGRGIPLMRGAATTTTAYPDPDTESTSVDGYVQRTNVNETWATIRAGAGNHASDTAGDSEIIAFYSSTTTNQWYRIKRSILLFDTSGITDADPLISAVLSIKEVASTGNDNFSPQVKPNIAAYSSTPASNTALEAADYGRTGTTILSNIITWDDFKASGTGTFNDFTLNATGEDAVDFEGISKFSLKNQNYDVANSAPNWGSDKYTTLYAGYADVAGTSNDPKLTVVHGTTFTPRAIMF